MSLNQSWWLKSIELNWCPRTWKPLIQEQVPDLVDNILDLEDMPESQKCPNCWELFLPEVWCKGCGNWILISPNYLENTVQESSVDSISDKKARNKRKVLFSFLDFQVTSFKEEDWKVSCIFFKHNLQRYSVQLSYIWNDFRIKVWKNWKICKNLPRQLFLDIRDLVKEFLKFKASG